MRSTILVAGVVALGTLLAAFSVVTSAAPASVNHQTPESQLLSVTLSADAERRLGIAITPVKRAPFALTRLYGGEVVAPPRSKNGEVNAVYPGGAAGSLYQLADARIAAAGRVDQLTAQLEGARAALVRAERMLENESGSARAVDEARTALAVAEADHRAALARQDLLGRASGSKPRRLWVRTPVFAGEISSLARNAPASVGSFDMIDANRFAPAQWVDAPRSADPTAGTVDLFFEIDATGDRFQPGERVKVLLRLEAAAEQLIIPWSAVVHDVNGNTWVYERVEEHVYARRAVEVRAVMGHLAALRSGPAEGTALVSTGAAELFGTEFGVPH